MDEITVMMGQANTESGDNQDAQPQSDDSAANAPEDVKTVEITSAETVSEESSKVDASDVPANDAVPEEVAVAPKKPRARRPRKTAVVAEPVEQPQAGD